MIEDSAGINLGETVEAMIETPLGSIAVRLEVARAPRARSVEAAVPKLKMPTLVSSVVEPVESNVAAVPPSVASVTLYVVLLEYQPGRVVLSDHDTSIVLFVVPARPLKFWL